jgi:putative phosphoribosyl transferase
MSEDMRKTISISVLLPINGSSFPGVLSLPPNHCGLVVFAHGSGSSRHSPRNLSVARILHASGIGTLLFDLLTPQEDLLVSNRFDIDLLSNRLIRAVEWARDFEGVSDVPIALFGASTGAAAAITAAAKLGNLITAVVSRGGRPDLAPSALPKLRSPTLLIVGAKDTEVEGLNRAAMQKMTCENQISIIPGATHLFEEGRSLEVVVGLAAGWFLRYFTLATHDRARAERGTSPSEGAQHPS